MVNNFWIGAEELFIVYGNGTYAVLSSWENEPLFMGRYENCYEYCRTCEAQYRESIIG